MDCGFRQCEIQQLYEYINSKVHTLPPLLSFTVGLGCSGGFLSYRVEKVERNLALVDVCFEND